MGELIGGRRIRGDELAAATAKLAAHFEERTKAAGAVAASADYLILVQGFDSPAVTGYNSEDKNVQHLCQGAGGLLMKSMGVHNDLWYLRHTYYKAVKLTQFTKYHGGAAAWAEAERLEPCRARVRAANGLPPLDGGWLPWMASSMCPRTSQVVPLCVAGDAGLLSGDGGRAAMCRRRRYRSDMSLRR